MEAEKRFTAERIEARGAVCVECLSAVAEAEALVDRCGATLCRACATEFYAACAGCRRLVARDEALTRTDLAGALLCAECFRAPASVEGAEPLPSDDEVEALVARYVALHGEKKRVDEEIEEIKERLKLVAGARPRVANAVVFKTDEGGVRCSYSARTTWDAAKLTAVEELLGGEEFSSLFERKVSFKEVRAVLDEFLDAAGDGRDHVREMVRAAAQVSETATINVIAPKKKKAQAEDA
jgi:hypothetical protein